MKVNVKYYLQQLKRFWMLFAQLLGKVNTMVLLSIVYLFIIGVMSLFVRIFRKDLLRKKIDLDRTSYWQIKTATEQTLDRHKFQF
jgi:hypothetical protein